MDDNSKPLDGQPWDFGFWAGGGFSVPGGTKDTHTINGGVRLGKVLTGDHFGSFMRGNFEWSADLMPLYYIWQPAPAINAYGAGFNPVNLKWNFTSSARTVPYLELGGGVRLRDGGARRRKVAQTVIYFCALQRQRGTSGIGCTGHVGQARQAVGAGRPGPITKRLVDQYHALTKVSGEPIYD